MAKKDTKTTKKDTMMKPGTKMPKTPKCVTVSSPSALSLRDVISAIHEFAPSVKSDRIATYLNSTGFNVTSASVRAYKANLSR